MSNNNIAGFLKQLRKTSGYSVNSVVEQLKTYGIDISSKTLYGYESGLSMLNADVFVALCRIYKCDNPMEIFGTSIIQPHEMKHIEKYRSLDPYGQETINIMLDREVKRMNQLKEEFSDTTIAQQDIRIVRYYQRLASAGTGQVMFEDIPTERIEIPDIPEYSRVSYAIGVNGDSMEPLYYDGDILLIETTLQIEVGEIGIFIVDGEAFVKQLGEGKLISLNDEYKDIPLTEYSNCMGRVIGKLEI